MNFTNHTYIETCKAFCEIFDTLPADALPEVRKRVAQVRQMLADNTLPIPDLNGPWPQTICALFFGPNSWDVFSKILGSWGSAFQGGNMWSSWDCYVTAARDILNLKLPSDDYSVWERCVKLAGFRYIHPDFAIMTDYPDRICVDENDRPHHEKMLPDGTREIGPSHAWPGLSVWFINGTQVNEQIVMDPKSQTIEQIDAENDSDCRAIRLDRFGWAEYIKAKGYAEIDKRENPKYGTKEALYVTDKGEKCIVVVCPTGRVFGLALNPEVKTCEEAQRWLWPIPVNIVHAT